MINLYFSDGKAFVWNADDWMKLRMSHRIIGELIGAIASFPRHSGFQGFPMVLMSEEAALLVEEGLCKLVESTDLLNKPKDNIIIFAEETEKRLYEEQVECMREKRIEQISSRIDMIIAGKQKKLVVQGKSSECNRDGMLQEEIRKLQPLSNGNTLLQIPTEHPWTHNTREVNITKLVPDITTGEGEMRFAVFKDLWKKGHHITAGTKFGGDFLVYPGDPVKFHAMYIVKCLSNEKVELRLSSVVGFGRLGVSVNKLTVYAFLNSEKEVVYQSLQWHETLC